MARETKVFRIVSMDFGEAGGMEGTFIARIDLLKWQKVQRRRAIIRLLERYTLSALTPFWLHACDHYLCSLNHGLATSPSQFDYTLVY